MPADVVLQSWKEISEYVGRTQRTLQRWERQFGFPVHRPSGKSRSAVMALEREILEWARNRPSVTLMRADAEPGGTKLPKPREEHNSANHYGTAPLADANSFPVYELARNQILADVVLERLQALAALTKRQCTLRRQMHELVQEQRTLREDLKQARRRRSGIAAAWTATLGGGRG